MTDIEDLLEEISKTAPSKGKAHLKPVERQPSQKKLREQYIKELKLDKEPQIITPKVEKPKEKLSIDKFMDQVEQEIEEEKRRLEEKKRQTAITEEDGLDPKECAQYLEARVLLGDEDERILRLYRSTFRYGKILSPLQLEKIRRIQKTEPIDKFREKIKVYRQLEKVEAKLKVIAEDETSSAIDHNNAQSGLSLIRNYYKKDKRLQNKQFAYLMRIIRKAKIQVD